MSERQLEIGEIPAFAGMEGGSGNGRGDGNGSFFYSLPQRIYPPPLAERESAGAGCKFNQLPIPAKAGISLYSNCFGSAVSERQLESREIPAFAGMERGAGMEEQETFIIPKQNKSPPY